jgi:hypothetical protein
LLLIFKVLIYAVHGSYSASSFTDTQISNSTVTFTFQGSSLAIYGAMRGNHGPFTVDVDGTVFPCNGYSSSDLFQVPIFQTNLQQGTHSVTLTNGGNNTFVDIDFVRPFFFFVIKLKRSFFFFASGYMVQQYWPGFGEAFLFSGR